MSEELREKQCTDLEWSLYKQVIELKSKLKEAERKIEAHKDAIGYLDNKLKEAEEQNKELPTIHDCFIKAETMNLTFSKDSLTKNVVYGFDRHQLKSFIEYVKNLNQQDNE